MIKKSKENSIPSSSVDCLLIHPDGEGGGKGTHLGKYLIKYFFKYNNNIFFKNWKFNLTESVTIGSLAAAWANRRQPDPPIGAARIIPHILESVALHFPFLLLLLLPPPLPDCQSGAITAHQSANGDDFHPMAGYHAANTARTLVSIHFQGNATLDCVTRPGA